MGARWVEVAPGWAAGGTHGRYLGATLRCSTGRGVLGTGQGGDQTLGWANADLCRDSGASGMEGKLGGDRGGLTECP